MTDADLLAKVPMFAQLVPADLAGLAALLQRRSCAAGEVVFLAGDVGNGLYVVRRGGVAVRLSSPGGKEVTLALLGPGEAFGELALLDGDPRSADAVARGETQLLLLPREAFLRYLAERQSVAMALLVALSRQVRRITGLVHDSAFLDVRARLARTLLELARVQGRPEGSTVAIQRPTQSELASLIGAVSRESVNKALRAYEQEGLLRQERDSLVLLDVERLRAELERDDG